MSEKDTCFLCGKKFDIVEDSLHLCNECFKGESERVERSLFDHPPTNERSER